VNIADNQTFHCKGTISPSLSRSEKTIKPLSTLNNFLRLNVGFIVHETIGYNRDFPFEFSSLHLPPDLNLLNLKGKARVSRAPQGLLLQLDLLASTNTECVRCLEEFELPLKAEYTELYAFSQNSVTESGFILPEDGILELEPIIREEMLLAVPINPFCSEDCTGLCPVCGEKHTGAGCQDPDDDIDPRLDILKSLLNEKPDQPSL